MFGNSNSESTTNLHDNKTTNYGSGITIGADGIFYATDKSGEVATIVANSLTGFLTSAKGLATSALVVAGLYTVYTKVKGGK